MYENRILIVFVRYNADEEEEAILSDPSDSSDDDDEDDDDDGESGQSDAGSHADAVSMM